MYNEAIKQSKQKNILGGNKTMRIYELNPQFDARKSFYGKAHVIDYENGTFELQSYGTIVSRCINGKVEDLGKWSNTTTRHQREVRKQFEN